MSISLFQDMIDQSDSIVFFGGAGTSTESGIPDFRSDQGLFRSNQLQSIPPETILSERFFQEEPEQFFQFYKQKMLYPHAKPNIAHQALAVLEKQGKLTAVITQNIDGLHQKAGSRNVIELHGSVHRNTCVGCGKTYSLEHVMNSIEVVPYCSTCGEVIKPDVVLYGEPLDYMIIQRAREAISTADMLIVGGTSLNVYPAAGFVDDFQGDCFVLINKSITPKDEHANLVFRESIGDVMGKAVLNR